MNSLLDNCFSVEELDQEFSKKISLVRECLELKDMDKDSAIFFKSLNVEIRDLKEQFKELRDIIKSGNEKVVQLQNLVKKLEKLKNRLDHMEENFPAIFKSSVPVVQKEINGNANVKSTKNDPALAKNKRSVERMKFVTVQEFENVPKYLKGRFKYEQVNKFVEEFNHALEGKYKLLFMSRKELKPPQLKIWQKLKSQENAETKGLFFCTTEDLKDYGNIKLDKASLNIMTILRHCGKVKEIRGPGPITRYTVV
ncbi:spindle and kinetochore-associated protein 1-like [Argiope bruennichi]|uniref:spindle and kinetochore-associated protein 1-like n=1 Tax=Argiope bruennichi TaxID=94029 RepID=UPI0024942610|nr:spindle and kinetochore-associated protein 1-like [Argiope bruennichi]